MQHKQILRCGNHTVGGVIVFTNIYLKYFITKEKKAMNHVAEIFTSTAKI